MAVMARQDDWTRITLRLPPDLHSALESAQSGRSLNAEIIHRLEQSVRIESMVAETTGRAVDDIAKYKEDVDSYIDGRLKTVMEEVLQQHGIIPPKG